MSRSNQVFLRDAARKTGEHGVSECLLRLRSNFESSVAFGGDLGRAQIALIEVVCHAGVKIGDLCAVWLIAVKIIFLGVVVAKVIIAYLSIKCEQIFTPFHYKNRTIQNEIYLSNISSKKKI